MNQLALNIIIRPMTAITMYAVKSFLYGSIMYFYCLCIFVMYFYNVLCLFIVYYKKKRIFNCITLYCEGCLPFRGVVKVRKTTSKDKANKHDPDTLANEWRRH